MNELKKKTYTIKFKTFMSEEGEIEIHAESQKQAIAKWVAGDYDKDDEYTSEWVQIDQKFLSVTE